VRAFHTLHLDASALDFGDSQAHRAPKNAGADATRLELFAEVPYTASMRAPNESHGDAHLETHTVRQRIAELLRSNELTAQQISKQASVAEREVAEHLRHLEHSLAHGGERLRVLAPHCVKCDFAFDQREKHGRPSRCPRCKSERVSKARFSVVPGA
jgi:transcriptional regulator